MGGEPRAIHARVFLIAFLVIIGVVAVVGVLRGPEQGDARAGETPAAAGGSAPETSPPVAAPTSDPTDEAGPADATLETDGSAGESTVVIGTLTDGWERREQHREETEAAYLEAIGGADQAVDTEDASEAEGAATEATTPPTTAAPVAPEPTAPAPTAPPETAPAPTTPPTTAPPAPVPPPVTSGVWDQIAACESGGNWAINTGNGYYGGLQFLHSTWVNMGGREFAEYPHQASREQQIAVAELVVAASGGSYSAWGGCAAQLGLP